MPLRLMPPTGTVLSDISKIISAIIWPAIIIALIFFLRDPLKVLVKRIGSSARAVSIGPSGVSVEFAAAVSEVQTPSSTVLNDLRNPTPQLASSAPNTLFDQLAAEAPAPYVLVDLGEGHEWLTSRLYLFAVMLRSMRRTRSLVFVETAGGVRGRFVGVGPAEQVHWALAAKYPWLEADYAYAYSTATTGWCTKQTAAGIRASGSFVLDHHGRLSEVVAEQLVRNFLGAVKPDAPIVPPDPEYVNEEVGAFQLLEHARWLNGGDIEGILGPSLDRFASLTEAVPRRPAEIAADTLRMQGHEVIALVDEQHRFRGAVVDRALALDALASETVNTGES